MSLNSFSTRILSPQTDVDPDSVDWDGVHDIIVIGFGGAGVCASLEATAHGADVAVVDRFMGGGATAICGSVFYCGGGTPQQKAAGLDDSPENMFQYLRHESQGVVADETLRRFCETSVENLHWLESHGVEFEGNLCPHKISYPIHEYRLYYSGNELAPAYQASATPAARGHIAKGMGRYKAMNVPALYKPLKEAALSKGISTYYQSEARRLMTDEHGKVIGVEIYQIPEGNDSFWHKTWQALATKLHMLHAPTANKIRKRILKIEDKEAKPKRLRAKRGVVLSTGGFIFNRQMVKEHAPKYLSGLPLGTTGDNGAGIILGMTVGGQTAHMNSVSAWRFINPPMAWPRGIIVNLKGERYCNEGLYGATIGKPMFEDHNGQAVIIIDHTLYRTALTQLRLNYSQLVNILPGLLNSYFNIVKADTVEELATKTKMPTNALLNSVDTYNRATRGEIPDPFGKDRKDMQALENGPFYAIDMSARNTLTKTKFSPVPVLTLGGLRVDEETGEVKAANGHNIKGLYAAGRTAVGICSHSYISGLSVADCVFSGRRAGAHAAKHI